MADILKNENSIPTSTPVNSEDENKYLVKEAPQHGLDSSWRRWKCLVCGYVYEGLSTGKMVCPRCGNSDPDKFDEAE